MAFNFLHERNNALAHAQADVTALARNTAAELGRMLQDHEQLLGRIAQRPQVRALNARDCDPIVAEYTRLHPGYTNLVVRDLSGRNDCSALARKLTPQQEAGVPGFIEAQRRDGLSVGAAHLGPLSGRWVAVLYYPVKDEQGAVAGLISLPMNLLSLGQRHLVPSVPDHVVLVVDHSGRILMRSGDAQAWVGKLVPESLRNAASLGAEQPFPTIGADGVSRFYAAAAVPGGDWRVLAGVPVDTVLAVPNRVLGVGLLLVLGSAAVALLAAWRVSLRLVRPIAALSQVATQIAYGNTALRAPQTGGPREIEAVAQAFNHMLDARDQSLHALSASEARFRTLTALSADWFWEVDSAFRFTRIDGQGHGPGGAPIQTYLGKASWEVDAVNLTPADKEHHRAQLHQHAEFRDFEIERPTADGQSAWVVSSGTPVWDAQGRFCGYLGVSRDITERKLHEQRQLTLTARVEELSRGLVQAQEETRRRFASELHDRTSPNLAALRINLAMIAAVSPEGRTTSTFANRIEDTRALIDDTNASIREICAELHPAALEIGGLLVAVQSYAQQLAARTGLRVFVECPLGDKRLGASLELALFRIVQEAMTNCAKHAQAKTLTVELLFVASPVRVVVSDDGVGFDAVRVLAVASRVGLGLLNMRETAEFVGGRLRIESAPGRGTQVVVDIEPQTAVSVN